MKKHPSTEQWMEFLYNEASGPHKLELREHLSACSVCREAVARFSSTKQLLNRWTVPETHRFVRSWTPLLKWATAAMVVLTTAFAAGKLAQPTVNVAALQNQIVTAVNADLRAQMDLNIEAVRIESNRAISEALEQSKAQMQELTKTIAALRKDDRQTVLVAMKRLEAQQLAESRNLRASLETVALAADQSLRDAQRKLVQLANYNVLAP